MTPAIRKRIYEVAVAGVAIVVFHGIISAEEGQLWLAVLLPVLGLARANVQE